MSDLKEVSIKEAIELLTGLGIPPKAVSNFNDPFWEKFRELTNIKLLRDPIDGGVEIFKLEDAIKLRFAEKLKSLGVKLS